MKGEIREDLSCLLAGFIIINTGKEKRRSEEGEGILIVTLLSGVPAKGGVSSR